MGAGLDPAHHSSADHRPISPIHPGQVLAREFHVPANRVCRLIAGKRAMTADTALRLEQWLGVEAGFWLNLQKSYGLDLAAEPLGDEIERTVKRRQPVAALPGPALP